jgi:SAF domain
MPPGQALSSRADSNGHGGPSGRLGGRLARQRRPAWIAAGVALVALAVLVNVYLFTTAGHRISVVRVARNVPIGQQLARADLDTSSVVVGPGVQVIPARQLGEVVGRRAAVDLRSGTLLTASQITTVLSPQPGQALVTVALKPGQLPPGGLTPGSQLRVVSAPGSQAASEGDGGAASPGPGGQPSAKDVRAAVDAVGGPDADGTMTVSLLVADAEANTVAREAAAGQIALVITARGA